MTTVFPRVEPRPGRLKRCVTCQEVWPISCYQRDRQNPDLHRNECKDCRNTRRRALNRGAPRQKPHGLRRLQARRVEPE